MKRKVLILLVLVVALFTVACSKDVEDTVVETPKENNVDVSENSPSTEEQESEEQESEQPEEQQEAEESNEDKPVESLAWPTDFMENVPVLEGEITKIKEDEENQRYIAFKSIEYADAVAYVEKLKEAGFTKDSAEYIAESNINFKGSDKNGNFVKLHWSYTGAAGVDMVKPEE